MVAAGTNFVVIGYPLVIAEANEQALRISLAILIFFCSNIIIVPHACQTMLQTLLVNRVVFQFPKVTN